MQRHQQSHILSTCHTAMQYLAEVRQVVATGTAADGTSYALFPEPLRTELLQTVDRVITDLEALVQTLVPGDEKQGKHSKGPGAARMWISTLLLLAQEQLDDIHPRRMGQQYGVLPEQDAILLQAGIERLHDATAAILSHVSNTSNTQAGDKTT